MSVGVILVCLPGPRGRPPGDHHGSLPQADAKKPSSVLDFTVKDIDGGISRRSIRARGQVALIVNTASPQPHPSTRAFKETYQKYKDQGFEILAFPANEFGAQEPGTHGQIKEFCTSNYKV